MLVSSFEWGFASGLEMALVCAIFFSMVGFATSPAESAFALNHFLLRPIYLIGLGYMIACWGGSETTLKRRLMLIESRPGLLMIGEGANRTDALAAADLCLQALPCRASRLAFPPFLLTDRTLQNRPRLRNPQQSRLPSVTWHICAMPA